MVLEKTLENPLDCKEIKPINITAIQVYAPTTNAEEAEVKQFYEDLQDLLELTPKKDVLFIIGDWNAKVFLGLAFSAGDRRLGWQMPWCPVHFRSHQLDIAQRTWVRD